MAVWLTKQRYLASAMSSLTASVHDLRYFAALLRGVNFNNRATVTVTKEGLTIKVEEARSIIATAFIFSGVFDEYVYTSENLTEEARMSQTSDDGDLESTAFEVPINTVIDCLNIFGTAGPSAAASANSAKKWRRPDGGSDHESGNEGGGQPRARRIEPLTGGEKNTGMRMSYAGSGYPLTMIIAEDANGPTTTCEVTTYEPEPQLDLDFDNDRLVLKIILKSSWLRDALSEIDPSCEKLTFIGNPPNDLDGRERQRNSKPILRIKAGGNFGTTEMDYPNDRDVLETFECTRSVSFSYRFSHILKTIRALQSSTKTSLRIDEEGLLSLQFLMPSPKPRDGENAQAFIEFRCLALDDEMD